MKTILAILFLPVLSFGQLTRQDILDAQSQSGIRNLDPLVQWANSPALSGNVTNSITVTNIVSRDAVEVRLERVIKDNGARYGILSTDGYSQITNKFTAFYLGLTNFPNTVAGASNQSAQRDRVIDDKAELLTAFALLKTLDVTAAAATTNISQVVTFSNSWAAQHGFSNGITRDDLEKAIRQ